MYNLFFSISVITFLFLPVKEHLFPAKNSTTISSNKTLKYRLIVSFISKGAGSDAKKRTAFLNYVETHPKKPAYKSILWGREGETDYCFTLKELSKKNQIAFVNDVKQLIGESNLVFISENAECIHKGR